MLNTIAEQIQDYWIAKLAALTPGPSGATEPYTTDFGTVTVNDLDRLETIKGNAVTFTLLAEVYQEEMCQLVVTAGYQIGFRRQVAPGVNPQTELQRVKADIMRLFLSDKTSGGNLTRNITAVGFEPFIGDDQDRLIGGAFDINIEYQTGPADPAARS